MICQFPLIPLNEWKSEVKVRGNFTTYIDNALLHLLLDSILLIIKYWFWFYLTRGG